MSSSTAKVVIAGQSGVGKSSLAWRLIYNKSYEPESTIGAALFNKTFQEKGHKVKLEVWDTAGQERYRAMGSYYFRHCHYCILVFDINDYESFIDVNIWRKLCQNALHDVDPVYILIGNKADVGKRQVSPEIIKQYCIKHRIEHYLETSAYTGDGIEEVYETLKSNILTRLPTLSNNIAAKIEFPDNRCSC